MCSTPFPPITRETAPQKASMAEDAWNLCDPERVSIGEDRVLHLNTSFTWPILIQAYMRIRTGMLS
jgi:nuclear transport factor 2 (NTF2) superfamily protein